MTRDEAAAALHYLETHHVVTLATTGAEGVWAAAVFYVNDGFELFFLSAAHTRHARNIAATPAVAATIQEDYDDWTAIQGIQMEGTAHALAGAAAARARALYEARFPFIANAPPVVREALAAVTWYHLVPSVVYFVDNRVAFGHRGRVFG
jgi:uncharacterized protein YhbP (UPF0306 family)